MNVGDFVEYVINHVVEAVERAEKKLGREIHIAKPQFNDNIQFDVAVTVENSKQSVEKATVTVLGIGLGADGNSESKSAQVSRVKFGIYIAPKTKQ